MNDNKIGDLLFYMEAEKQNKIFNDVSMNIKVYSSASTYEIKSYVGEEDFLNKIIENDIKDEKQAGEIKTLIKGGKTYGELLFSRLKIPSINFGTSDKKLFPNLIFDEENYYVWLIW